MKVTIIYNLQATVSEKIFVIIFSRQSEGSLCVLINVMTAQFET